MNLGALLETTESKNNADRIRATVAIRSRAEIMRSVADRLDALAMDLENRRPIPDAMLKLTDALAPASRNDDAIVALARWMEEI